MWNGWANDKHNQVDLSSWPILNIINFSIKVFGSISKQLTWNDKRFDIGASGQIRRPTINQWCKEEWANNKHNQVDLSSWPVLNIINFSIKVFGSCSKPSNMLEVGKWFQHMCNLEVRIYYWLILTVDIRLPLTTTECIASDSLGQGCCCCSSSARRYRLDMKLDRCLVDPSRSLISCTRFESFKQY